MLFRVRLRGSGEIPKNTSQQTKEIEKEIKDLDRSFIVESDDEEESYLGTGHVGVSGNQAPRTEKNSPVYEEVRKEFSFSLTAYVCLRSHSLPHLHLTLTKYTTPKLTICCVLISEDLGFKNKS